MNIYTKIAINYFRNLISGSGHQHGLFFSESAKNPLHIVSNEIKFFITQIENSIVIIKCEYDNPQTHSIDICMNLNSKSMKEAAQKARKFYEQTRSYFTYLNNQ
ncbi:MULTISPECIES: hypothetical protein [Acinetobacter]|uniref:hypothetical protein n=1 Tax=Acinetobacter TaxID=469 RepID=UPI003017E223